MVLGGGASERWLGLEGGAFIYEISALTEGTPENYFTHSATWGQWEDNRMEEGSHQTLSLLAPWSYTSSLQNHEK